MSAYVRALGIISGAVTIFVFYKNLRRLSSKSSEKKNEPTKVGFYTKYVKVPRGCVGIIIGRHGKNARQLEFETKTFTQIVYYNETEINSVRNIDPKSQWDMRYQEEEEDWNRENKKPTKKPDEFAFLKIQGKTLESIELALCKVKAIITDWHRNNTASHLKIPKDAVGYVIGKNAHNLKMICHICNVRTNMICIDNDHEVMEIRGTEEGVNAAIQRFETSIARYFRISNEEEIKEFASETRNNRGIFEDVQVELKDIENLRRKLEAEEEFWRMAKDSDSEDDCVFGPPESCSRACRVVEIFQNEGFFNPLVPILFFGKVPSNFFLQNEWVKNDDEVRQIVEKSKELRELKDCDCENEKCLLPKDDWVWEHPFDMCEVKIVGKHVLFHPLYAYGAAAVRGDKAMTGNTIAFWEILGDGMFGTSVMFGIGTYGARVTSGYHFIDLIGCDENSWGINHKGWAFHNGLTFRAFDGIPSHGRHSMAMLFNGPERTLSFYLDGEYLGTPFVNINTSTPLYPMLASTAQQSHFVIGRSLRWGVPNSLFRLALQRVYRDHGYERNLPLPKEILKELGNMSKMKARSAPDSKIMVQVKGPCLRRKL